jgi:signal recognition particle GTPase
VEALRARIAELEAAIRRPAPASPAAGPRVVVLVGPAGTGKTTLALRLAQQPERLGAATAAVLLVRPDARGLDPSPLYWSGGVAAATVSSGADAQRARAEFADADLLIVDTPALPLHPALARPLVAQLGEALAPLAPLEVLFVLDATRAADAFGPATLSALGLRPDALALTRADEAAPDAPARWSERLGLPLQALSSGTAAADLDLAPTTPTETHDMTAPLPDTLAAYA